MSAARLLPLLLGAGAVGVGLVALQKKASAAPSSPAGGGSPFPTSGTPGAGNGAPVPTSGAPSPAPPGGFPATTMPPEAVLARIAGALASGDSATIRHEADLLEAEGWVLQARDLRNVAATIDAMRGQSGGGSPAPTTPSGGSQVPPDTVPASFPVPFPGSLPSTPPASSSGRRTLRQGSSGADVVELQQRLNSRGERLTADGKFGPLTTGAVKRFQAASSLKQDGVVGPQTWNALLVSTIPVQTSGGTPTVSVPGVGNVPIPTLPTATPATPTVTNRRTLRQGSSGADVIELQQRLNSRGAGLATDGKFGPKTTAAVKVFQSSAGLAADGVVGPKTWGALLVSTTVAGDEPDDEVRAARNTQRKGAVMLMNVRHSGPARPNTRKSVRRFQNAVGLPANGLYDMPTALLVIPLGFVPEPPLVPSPKIASRWHKLMMRAAERDPQRGDEWGRAAGATVCPPTDLRFVQGE